VNQENRPNPDELLKAIQRNENREKKGRLKIFLGMAAGVGKTYAMLEEAQNLNKAGIDVRIGTVETHNRIETMKLVEGLKVIPEKIVYYKDKEFSELNLDEIIRLKPKIVLVDELAHSNIPGLRHEKRWQDVVEILANGIDVHTTLNVQHIESLKDIVENISSIMIRETVPDLIIEQAAFIQIVDLVPNELLKRLDEGKVYLGDQSKIAALNFFKEDKLTALREILLRYTAEKIDHDLHNMVSIVENENYWKPREKLLVAVGSSPYSQKLIRNTRRLASILEAPWIAVYVDTGDALSEEDKSMLDKNLSLARDLGAEVITTYDPNIADAIQRIARRRGITQIIVGRSPQNTFFSFFKKMSLQEKLAKDCKDIDIHMVRQEQQLTTHRKKLRATVKTNHYSSYLFVFFYVGLLALLNFMIYPVVGYQVIGEIFFIGILALTLFFKKGPIFFATLLFSLIWFFFFIPDEFKFSIESILLLLLFFMTAITTGILVDRYRTHQEMLAKREEQSLALYRIIREIATATSSDKLFKEIDERLERLFKTNVEIVIKEINDGLVFSEKSELLTDEKEKAAISWVFENEVEAGWSTDTLPLSQNLYIPLKGFHEIVGILVCQKRKGEMLSLDEKNFLYTVSKQLGYHIERSFLEERANQKEMLIQIEKINKSILRRLGNEFKPLALDAKHSLNTFKEKLASGHNKVLISDFSKIEKSLEKLTKVFEHVSLMTDIDKKNEPPK